MHYDISCYSVHEPSKEDEMFETQQTEGRGRGPQSEGQGRRRRSCGPGGDWVPARFRAGGEGGGQGKGRGCGHGHGPGFGHGHGGHGHGRGPWSRAKRGDVRAAILLALADEPMHGYQIMQWLEERSGGAWRPSPGSVYPTLQLLEDQGLIKGADAEGRRVFSLTESGAAEAAAVKERLGDAPFGAEGGEQDPRFALRQSVFQLGAAVKQVGMAGSAADVQQALEILREARKRIYALLADAQ
jgi:DNA-binding PadR family transcriptional regulator